MEQLLGKADSHLVPAEHQKLEARTAEAWQQLVAAARQAGFQLALCSGWRSFERQLAIFNGKARGQRPLKDRTGKLCVPASMSDAEILEAILAWSALPGGSRHHWGTDLDWYDAGRVSRDTLQLEPWEYRDAGPCAELFAWMEDHMAEFGFFRPYRDPLGGVAPEPWHISFAPVAIPALAQFDRQSLERLLHSEPIALKHTLLTQLPELVARYCYRISSP